MFGIVFGRTDPETGTPLKNAFKLASNREQCLLAWSKCGNVPLTVLVLSQLEIRHKTFMKDRVTVDINLEPEGHTLLVLEESNHQSCDFLSTFGLTASN